ncbi:MAG: FecR domain-containing protein [Holophagales bacterium]|nr:FecR domain-containing protein [Holophagales bacterium]
MLSTMCKSQALRALKSISLLAPAAIICPAPAFAQDPDEYLGERPERYAMVSHLEGNVVIRKWDDDEELTKGTPISEGDAIVESNGRGVIQFGDGTRLAFAERTRFEVATLFDDQGGRTTALFRLSLGRLRIATGPQSEAFFRIDTPSGSVTMDGRCVVSIEVGNDRSLTIKVYSGNVAIRNKMDTATIGAGERLTIYSDNERFNRTRSFNTYELDSFDSWAENRMSLTRSESSQRLPTEIRYYANSLDGHGDWVNVVDVGWCWRPSIALAGWRPYWRGHWGAYRGGMTWVSYDPFGYVTHHYGRWGWSPMYGWYWIPGVFYSPAWVAWNIMDGLFGWAPLGYYNRPIYWGHHGWNRDLWNVVHVRNVHARNIYSHTMGAGDIGNRFHTAANGNRSLAATWRQGPLIVTRQEFKNPEPSQFRRALSREVSNERIAAYERQAGRQLVVRRQAQPNVRPTGAGQPADRPFEDQASRRALADRPVVRPSNRPVEPRRSEPRDNGTNSDPDRTQRRTLGRRADSDEQPKREVQQNRKSNDDDSRREVRPSRRTNDDDSKRGEARQADSRQQQRGENNAPPSRGAGSREERNNSGSSDRGSQAPPSRSVAPPRNSSPPARTSPPPDRSRNLRR